MILGKLLRLRPRLELLSSPSRVPLLFWASLLGRCHLGIANGVRIALSNICFDFVWLCTIQRSCPCSLQLLIGIHPWALTIRDVKCILMRLVVIAHPLCLSSASPRLSSRPWEGTCDVQELGANPVRNIVDTDGAIAAWRLSRPTKLIRTVENYMSSRVVRADFALVESCKPRSVSPITRRRSLGLKMVV